MWSGNAPCRERPSVDGPGGTSLGAEFVDRTMRGLPVALTVLLLTGCGSAHPARPAHPARRSHPAAGPKAGVSAVSLRRQTPSPAPPQALVTAETENQLLVVDLPSGRIVRAVPLPADPEDLAAVGRGGVVVAISSRAGKVTVLDRRTLRRIKTFAGFDQPHIAAISPDGQYAYITDDSRGTLTVIRLGDLRETSTVAVGAGAHHLTFSPNRRRVWLALGESASQIMILNTADPAHPHLIGSFDPGFPAHDLGFSPNGREVWISSAAGADITAFDAVTHRAMFRVPVGPAPQHLAFDGAYAYVTSGYGSTIAKVDASSGRVVKRTSAPYGSFELAAADGYVATSSLLRGTLAIYTPGLALLRVVKLAPATREVAISRP